MRAAVLTSLSLVPSLLAAAPAEVRPGAIAVEVEPVPRVQYFLDRARAKPGDLAVLTLSILTDTPLTSVSVAINFDETRLRIEDADRVLEAAPQVPFDDVAKTDVDNRNDAPGDQAAEGWLYLELTASGLTDELKWPTGEVVPLYRFRFRVLADAPEGFTAVSFAKVGAQDAPELVNAAEVKDGNLRSPLAPADLVGGGVIILGLGEIGFFLRGDANMDQTRDISDPITTLSFLFLGAKDLVCDDAADANDDGLIDISDPVFTLDALYQSGGPHPEPNTWGPDPSSDKLCCEETGGCS